jgi:alpha-tubulin suppressor-like RCC1 family protein
MGNGTIKTWGSVGWGLLGNGTSPVVQTTPAQANITGVTKIASGGYHTLALKNDGTVWAWGRNDYHQLGDGTTTNRNTPILVAGISGVTSIKASGIYSYVLKNDGTLWVWGNTTLVPTQHTSLSGVINLWGWNGGVPSIWGDMVAQKNDGTLWAFIGPGSPAQLPVSVTGSVEISAGANNYFALKNDGTLWGWRGNTTCQLADSTLPNSIYTPVQIMNLCPLQVPISTFINERNENEFVFLSPNPTSNTFTLSTPSQKNSHLQILNPLGEKIMEQNISSPKTEINLGNHPNGIYFVQLKSDEGVVTRKIILTK